MGIHGLRKLACASMAQTGATAHEIMAVSGHTTLAMVEHYTKSANRVEMAKSAIIKRFPGADNQPRTTRNPR
jgi:integrase